jgi:hypothetical protein
VNKTIAMAVVAAALAVIIILPTGSTGATGGATVPMKIIVEGLQANDVAVLRLGVDDGTLKLAGQPLYEYTADASNGAAQEIEISPNLEDGRYLLAVDAPEKYFREPRGYLFMVYQSSVVNPVGHAIRFKLVPPEARDYEPYREPMMVPNPSTVVPAPGTEAVKYRVELVADLSAPPKQPIQVDIPSIVRVDQWWEVPQLRAAAVVLLTIAGAVVFAVVRITIRLRARRTLK